MKNAPIPLTLDLWSLGHSGADIAEKLGYPDEKHIARIIEHAREIGDPRAVYHFHRDRILGKGIPWKRREKGRYQTKFRGFALVQLLHPQVREFCKYGHSRADTPPRRQCRTCARLSYARRS